MLAEFLYNIKDPSMYDSDLYKFTMGQFVYKYFPSLYVQYNLTVRGNQSLTVNNIDFYKLKSKLENISICMDMTHKFVLEKLNIFSNEYLEFLKTIQLPKVEVFIGDDNEIHIQVYGPWKTTIYLETPIMAIISELYSEFNSMYGDRKKLEDSLYSILQENIKKLSKLNELQLVEFGTRRRFSRSWQSHIIKELKSELKNKLVGSSNVNFSGMYNLPCCGTMAHELFMVTSAININENNIPLIDSMKDVLNKWKSMYPYSFRIILPDTYTTKHFIHNILNKEEFDSDWKGFRHDSGNPDNFFSEISSYTNVNNKTTFFSDSLSIENIEYLYNRYSSKTNCIFGWGTGLTNNCNLPFLNMVFKPTRVRSENHGRDYITLKISDTPGKCSGNSEEIKKYI